MSYFFILNVLLYVCLSSQDNIVSFNPPEIYLEKNDSSFVDINIRKNTSQCETYVFNYAYEGSKISVFEEQKVIVPLSNLTVCGNNSNFRLQITALKVGWILVGVGVSKNNSYELAQGFFKVTVMHWHSLDVLQQIVGWVYFLAWSFSFYPQIISNLKRKSVVGLSLDFTALNVLGFLSYSIFNISLFWIPVVQRQYRQVHPRGNIPVEANDVAFSLHALAATSLTLLQCFIFERGSQKVSKLVVIIIGLLSLISIITLFIAIGHVITWIVFVTVFSYVKLFITFVKYFPQAWMNFSRKSTEGWNLGNVILDFTGGTFSFLQMILIASNNDDWSVLYGNVTKLGLGVFAIIFDLVFFLQHCLYSRGVQLYQPI